MSGSYKFARYVTSNGKKFLCQDGHRFYKNAESKLTFDGKQRIYWRCAGYGRFACNMRAISQVIGGLYFFRFFNFFSS